MDALSIVMVIVFGAGALVAAVWSSIGLAMGNRGYLWGTIGAVWAALLLAAFFIAMAADWGGCGAHGEHGVVVCGEDCSPAEWQTECRTHPGRASAPCASGAIAPSACPARQEPAYQYCEAFQTGSVRQPWSTWSDLAFIASGLWILCWLGFSQARTDNPMSEPSALSVTYGLIVITMGPLSMLLHASMKSWAGWFDAFSVYNWLFFNGAYVFNGSFGWPRARSTGATFAVWALLTGFFGVASAVGDGFRFFGIIAGGAAWVIGEVVFGVTMAAGSNPAQRTYGWFVGLVATLVVTMGGFWLPWNLDVVGPQTCRDIQSFPGHAVFHVLAAVATFLAFVTFRSERRT
jgi:hypothetical protein